MGVWSEINSAQLSTSNRLDAEYFKPEYINIYRKLMDLNCIKLRYEALLIKCGPFGSTIKKETYCEGGVTVARPFNINNCEFQRDNLAFISEDDFKRKKLLECKNNDIFFSRVGDVKVGILKKNKIENITISPNIVMLRLKSNNLLPEYTTIFFNTPLGKKQILRAQKVVAQPTISTSLLNELLVFNPGKKEQEKIANLFNKSINKKRHSEYLYLQAQKLLEYELGLNTLVLDKPKSYEASFSEIVGNSRADAEYYTPQADEIYRASCFNNSKKLKNIFSIIRGKTPTQYFKKGTPVLKTKNIRIPIIDETKIEDFSYTSGNHTIIKNGDLVLAAMGVGSLGRISYVFDDSSKAIIDGTLRILRPKEDFSNQKIPALLFLTSKYGQILIYKGIVGSTGIISLPDNYLNDIKIPIIRPEVAKKITVMVQSSYNAKKESEHLLEQAKKSVEKLIEGGNRL